MLNGQASDADPNPVLRAEYECNQSCLPTFKKRSKPNPLKGDESSKEAGEDSSKGREGNGSEDEGSNDPLANNQGNYSATKFKHGDVLMSALTQTLTTLRKRILTTPKTRIQTRYPGLSRRRRRNR